MKFTTFHSRRGRLWFCLNGIPLMLICAVGGTAARVGFTWLEAKCAAWYDDIWEKS